jgi:hypothetical protein
VITFATTTATVRSKFMEVRAGRWIITTNTRLKLRI